MFKINKIYKNMTQRTCLNDIDRKILKFYKEFKLFVKTDFKQRKEGKKRNVYIMNGEKIYNTILQCN